MATELANLSGCTVQSMTFAPNQARVLNAFHAVKIDSGAVLAEGTAVQFTDGDLGLVFLGKITKVQKAYQNGEGVQYICADGFRTLVKQTALIDVPSGGRSTRIRLTPGTSMNDSLSGIFSGSRLSTVLPGGLNNGLTDETLPMTDRGGQSVDSWVQELLKNTNDGIAFVEPNAGSPRLTLRNYSGASDVTLTQGTYEVINPSSGELVIENGSFGGSLDRKYERVTMEGCGEFLRHELEYMSDVEVTKMNDFEYHYRFYIPGTPEKRILCRYIDPVTGKCGDNCQLRIRLGESSDADILIGQLGINVDNPHFKVDEVDGRLYIYVVMYIAGVYGVGATPAVPNVSAWLTYTSWEGGLLATVESSDSKLDGEGEFVEQHDEYVKYSGPGINVDQTAQLTALANQRATLLTSAADQAGSFNVHIKGLNSNLSLGSRITNFGNCRVQSIQYNFVLRSMTISISDLPLRKSIEKAKQDAEVATIPGGNWRQNRYKYIDNCFCATQADVTPVDEYGGGGGGGGGGDNPVDGDNPWPERTWDCNRQTYVCEERADGRGAHRTWGDCDAVCRGAGWKFIRCVGCVPANADQAQFDTKDECEAAYPPGSQYFFDDCKYRCDPAQGCVAGQTGPFADYASCEADCVQSGSGYGPSSGGSDPEPPDDPDTKSSGKSSTMKVMVDAWCNESTKEIVKVFRTIPIAG